jgi:hypothetical protein
MALTAQQIQSRITAIRKARDSGVYSVTHSGTTTTFRSLADMNAIIAELEAQLATVNGTPKKARVSYVQQSTKGL